MKTAGQLGKTSTNTLIRHKVLVRSINHGNKTLDDGSCHARGAIPCNLDKLWNNLGAESVLKTHARGRAVEKQTGLSGDMVDELLLEGACVLDCVRVAEGLPGLLHGEPRAFVPFQAGFGGHGRR